MHYVYILQSEKVEKYYVGQTPDLELRLKFHNELSESSFTPRYRPWKLLLAIPVNNGSEAVFVEGYIKGRKSKHYIRRLMEDPQAVAKLLRRFRIVPPCPPE
jgi:putative endonuclease